jgi:hypothetical protein
MARPTGKAPNGGGRGATDDSRGVKLAKDQNAIKCRRHDASEYQEDGAVQPKCFRATNLLDYHYSYCNIEDTTW